MTVYGDCAPPMSLEKYSEFTRPRNYWPRFTMEVWRYEEHSGSLLPAGDITLGGDTAARTIKQLHEQATERLLSMIDIFGPDTYIEEEDLVDVVLEAEAADVPRRRAEIEHFEQLRRRGEVCSDYPRCGSHD